jgi:hypothetical protein
MEREVVMQTRSRWRPFGEAREFTRRLGFKKTKEWYAYCKSGEKPADIPAYPERVYADHGWVGYGDWLGTGVLHPRDINWRPFDEACEFVRAQGLKSQHEWREWCRSGQRPPDIPAAPHNVYKDQWRGYGHWLGTNAVAAQRRVYKPFEEARAYVRSLGLKNQAEWEKYRKSKDRPPDIPSNPNRQYPDEWVSMGDWLGTGFVHYRYRRWRPYEEAKAFVRSLDLKSETEWREYLRSGQRPDDIPTNPNAVYADQWEGMGEWLGTGRIADREKVFRPFEEARAFVRSLGFKRQADWFDYCRSGQKPDDIPTNPHKVYGDKWKRR